jgi:hypothetical protein
MQTKEQSEFKYKLDAANQQLSVIALQGIVKGLRNKLLTRDEAAQLIEMVLIILT